MKKPSSKKTVATRKKQYTFEELAAGDLCLFCVKNQKYLGAAETASEALSASYAAPFENTVFRFIPGPDNTVQIYSNYHRNIVSGFGKGWLLQPRTVDVAWSIFTYSFDAARGTVILKSAQSIAKATPFVIADGKTHSARIGADRRDADFVEFALHAAPLREKKPSARKKATKKAS